MQTSIANTDLATGIPGEFSRSSSQESDGAILNSGTEANNVVGRAVKTVDGNDYEVGVAADGNIAGVLVSPKISYRPALTAQAFLPNGSECEVATKGFLFVTLAAAADKGDFVYFADATGILATAAPAAVAPASHTRLPGGIVTKNNTAAGVGEIYFDLSGSTETPTA